MIWKMIKYFDTPSIRREYHFMVNHAWFKYLNFEKIDLGTVKYLYLKMVNTFTMSRLMEKYKLSTL